jgi:hypothetical protein
MKTIEFKECKNHQNHISNLHRKTELNFYLLGFDVSMINLAFRFM